jgi:predicted transcriptional regulator
LYRLTALWEHRLSSMEVQFTPEQEAQISQIAHYTGTPAEQLVKQAALRMVEEDAAFRAGVRRGVEQADRGEFIEHDAVKERIDRLLRSQ